MLTDTRDVDVEVESLLLEGQDAARRGDNATARSFLSQVVERDPSNEKAWMWLSGVVEDPAEQQICLENVLVINPENSKARKGLAYLHSQTSGSESEAAPVAPAAPAYAAQYDASIAEGVTLPQGVSPYQEHFASPGPVDGALAGEASGSDAAFDIEGLELQTSPSLEGSLPWLQAVEQKSNDGNDRPDTFSFEPAVAALPFNQDTQETLPGGASMAQVAAFSSSEASFSDVAGNNGTYDIAPGDIPPLTSDPDELPMFDFSSFTESIGGTYDGAMSGQSGAQQGEDSGVASGDQHFKFEEHVAALAGPDSSNSGFMPLPAGGFNEMVNGNNGPMGPLGDVNLPAPSDLPGYKGEVEDWSQPWYSQTAEQQGQAAVAEPAGVPLYSSGALPDQLPRDRANSKTSTVTTMKCPNCREDVADTSLACPNCRFNFFINCPNCHELVDASQATPGKAEPCPHCTASIDLLQLGQQGVDGASQYKSTKLAEESTRSLMATSLDVDPRPRKRIGFGWVVDIVWLVTIITIVWALTQLPTWLHLTGQY